MDNSDPLIVHSIPAWEFDHTREPLPPDGKLYVPDKDHPGQLVRNTAEPEDGRFGVLYFEEGMKRKLIQLADEWYGTLIYAFV